jgi:ATP-dependent helicase/nuclease subunit A
MMIEQLLPDDEARRRIVEDLDLNFLVEAGAGSGKTQSMVDRMIELVATGRTTVDRIAAVTFTKKAATELRERFQERLERRLAEGEGDRSMRERRIGEALTDIDQAFIGTIHSFCARVLREHPLEAGLDPDFEEVSGAAERKLLATPGTPSWSGSRRGRSRR